MSMDAQDLHSKNAESSLPALENTNYADVITEKELSDLEKSVLQLENKNFAQNIQLRKFCARFTLIGVCVWLTFVIAVTAFEGFGVNHFSLGQTVLMTLFTTTTANVVGTLWIIYRYLFKDGN